MKLIKLDEHSKRRRKREQLGRRDERKHIEGWVTFEGHFMYWFWLGINMKLHVISEYINIIIAVL